MSKVTSDIDRKTASKILSVSVRTIDRYIRSGKIAAYQRNGRIWLNKREIVAFPKSQESFVKQAIDIRNTVQPRRTVSPIADIGFYKDLYEEAQRMIQEHQQKLEQANYRIGQLESQILNHQPRQPNIIERRTDDSAATEMMRRDIVSREKEIEVLKEIAKRERMNRLVFATLTYVLLATLPVLWYFMR
ncbi:helix-turn-helix domain-containing protein [Candidatus Peregrinibacteria bacterium]|nr:helix-turn-helix domain-containing protein [Candidatus Peregrinibacteria bacterium]